MKEEDEEKRKKSRRAPSVGLQKKERAKRLASPSPPNDRSTWAHNRMAWL